ncbi:MAG: hypothetical protein ACTSUE_14795 [Promethearchaeota archaeon]
MQVQYTYNKPSYIHYGKDKSQFSLSPDQSRSEKVCFHALVKTPLVFRDCMLALQDIVKSDLRRQKKDRTGYFEWLDWELNRRTLIYLNDNQKKNKDLEKKIYALQKKIDPIKTRIASFNAPISTLKSKFYRYLRKVDYDLWYVLDPIVSVHPDCISFEAFSKDESTYACITASMEKFDVQGKIDFGTTNIDFSVKLGEYIEKIRTSKPLFFDIEPGQVAIENGDQQHIEKKIDLPESWIRGILQVSSAMGINGTTFDLDPADLYTICGVLHRKKARWSPKALCYVLVPNERIKVILEPWNHELVLKSKYYGDKPQIIRTWGRRRLLLLEKLLPRASRIRVKLLGKGLPSFYMVELDGFNFILGLSSWVSKDWGDGVLFNILAGYSDTIYEKEIVDLLKQRRTLAITEIKEILHNFDPQVIRGTLGYLYRHGLAYFDPVCETIRYRELSQVEFPEKLTKPSLLEKAVLELVNEIKDFTMEIDEKQNHSLRCKILVDRITLNPFLKINGDGVVLTSKCGCENEENKEKILPCAHVLAMHLYYLKQPE